jgi:hypothetical protein
MRQMALLLSAAIQVTDRQNVDREKWFTEYKMKTFVVILHDEAPRANLKRSY